MPHLFLKYFDVNKNSPKWFEMSSGYDRTYDNSYYNFINNQDRQHIGSAPSVQQKYQHVGDFTPFYIAITICTIIGFSLFLLNIILGCCSKYSNYWKDRHTGNRWIISLWTATPHNQLPLDCTAELQEINSEQKVVYYNPHPTDTPIGEETEFLEFKKRESEI